MSTATATPVATHLAYTVDARPFAAACTWVARHIPSRPAIPVLGGIRLDVADGVLTLSGFDYDVSAVHRLDVAADGEGTALVSGRLLAEVAKTLPDKAVNVVADDAALHVVCGSVRLTLPLMRVDEYPTLPAVPESIGVVDPEEFAAAVERVASAAAAPSSALVELTGVHTTFGPDGIRMVASDAYRIAVDHIGWAPAGPNVEAVALVPATVLTEVARAYVDEPDVRIGVGEGLISLAAGPRTVVSRLLAADKHRGVQAAAALPARADQPLTVATAALAAAVKRAQLVTPDKAPVRLALAAGSITVSGAGQADAEVGELVDCEYVGGDLVIGFNPGFLLDALAGIRTAAVELSITSARKPVLFTAGGDPAYRHVVVPIRLAVTNQGKD